MELVGAEQAAVEEFWARCGPAGPFPRDLERPLALGLPVFIVKVPQLGIAAMRAWLAARGADRLASLTEPERRLRGGLLAASGQGVIFLDGADSDDERRLTLAHEVAHFLVDYWLPRRTALLKLGPALAEVLDGQRSPTPEERLSALLLCAPLQTYTDLLGRGKDDATLPEDLDQIEERADRVALALLAPAKAVWSHARDLTQTPFDARLGQLIEALVDHFGLPPLMATRYGHTLLSSAGRGPSWAERLRI